MQQRVLILDDNDDILWPCKIILQKAGYAVETRTDCLQIVQVVRDLKPDIILLDLKIPPSGGDVALLHLKNDSATSKISVMLFSAADNLSSIAKHSLADGFIQKPFDIDTLLKTVGEKLQFQSNRC